MIYQVKLTYKDSGTTYTHETYVEAKYQTDALQQVLGAFTDYYCYITKVEVTSLEELDKERKQWRHIAIYLGATLLAIVLGSLLGVLG